MLVKIQNAAQSWVAKFVAGVIIVVLVLFGFGAFNLFAINEPIVASVNGFDITERQLTSEIDRAKRQFRETYPTQYSDEQIDGWINEEFALARLIDATLFIQATEDLRLTISDKQFGQLLQTDPQFQLDGEFDESTFRETLERSGLSVQRLRGLQTESNVRAQLLSVIEDTEFSTEADARSRAKFEKQTRDISVLRFAQLDFVDTEAISDEDVATHYELNSDQYMSEGTFDFDYVEIKREMFVEPSELTDEEVRALYESEIEARDSSAQRRGRHILVNVDDDRTDEEAVERLAEIQERLDSGEDFAEVAKEMSDDRGSKEDGGDLGFATRETFVPSFADMLWTLEVNEVSKPVRSQFGYHIIELLEIEEVEHPTFEDRREGLIEESQLESASVILNDTTTEVDKLAFEQADSLQPIADTYDVEVQSMTDVNSESFDGLFLHPQVRSAFMSADVVDNGFNSRVVNVNDDFIVVGRLIDRTAPTLKSLDEVKDSIKTQLVEEHAEQSRDAKLASVLDKLRDDRDYDAAEAQVESRWTVYENQTRTDSSVDPAILLAAFSEQLPDDDERVITEATSEFLPVKFIVVVSRQQLADFVLLGSNEQEEIVTNTLEDAKAKSLASFVAGLRLDASIDTDRVAFTVE